ncbi:Polyphenol oxidase, central domain-containing protein [Artemisia annua]|uniref:Polyphenol oxidase, central domain-containing protein n=1 Tax=Artemisia annua TaxID=35608 RepID=A0A2U1PEX4_ARTAN|nr:Polyphenol oxidase, central domain-containing protein [Artemisia annua]
MMTSFSLKTNAIRTQHYFNVSCNTNHDENHKNIKTSLDMKNVDRRNLLLGLGGLYGAANFTSIQSAFATPIAAPDDISDCVATAYKGIGNSADARRSLACCPPVLSEDRPKDYVLPKNPVIRVRPPAHRVSEDYMAKYRKAIQAMRDLDENDPRSYKQQARIHCAYCNAGYTQKQSGHPEKEIQVHNSWLFFPFHRWYLYFYERILGSLIDDPTFALPYWNWDNPTGMTLPPMFEDPVDNDLRRNSIFNAYRDARHLPPAIVDLEYNGRERGASCIDQLGINMSTMYKQMISNAPDYISFFGGEYRAGQDPISIVGSIERGAHTAMHIWASDPRMPNREDMGNFYSAGYDPLFYAHHANVDRMWNIWKQLGGRGHHDPTDPDWLDASYVFYDENKQLVRVYNRNCCDTTLMGYDYETSRIPWSRARPVPRTKNPTGATRSMKRIERVEEINFPMKLDQIVNVLVKRPATNRTKQDKEKASEMLILDGIRFDSEKFVKFDVFINDKDDAPATTAADSQMAGSFAELPHNHSKDKMFMMSAVRFGLTELLEDMESEDDESLVVTLVPRAGTDDASVSEIKIQLIPIE